MLSILRNLYKKKKNIARLSKGNELPKELTLARQYMEQSRATEEAEKLCLQFLEKNPNSSDGLRMLISVFAAQRKHPEVVQNCSLLLELEGSDLWTLRKLAEAYSAMFEYDKAVDTRKSIVSLCDRNLTELHMLANEYTKAATRDEEALSIYQEILGRDDVKVTHFIRYAHCLNTVGQLDEAVNVLKKLLQKGESQGAIYWELANFKSYQFSDDEIFAMEKLIEQHMLEPSSAHFLFYALGKAYEDKLLFEQSFHYYERANIIQAKRQRYDTDLTENRYKWITKLCNAEFFQEKKNAGYPEIGPIFVVGMHRSGSTLVEQILASHSEVEGTKELPFVIDIQNRLAREAADYESKAAANAKRLTQLSNDALLLLGKEYISKLKGLRNGSTYFVDKMPINFLHIGLILAILPNAKIIDARRHPLAVGVSNYRQALGATHTSKLYDIGHFYQYYVKVMRHWHSVFPGRIHRVQYEDMVSDSETEIRRLLTYCNLPFEESCIHFYDTKRSVKTPSANQVRQPIYDHSVEQWLNYEPYLSPLKQGLGDVLYTYMDDVIDD